MKLLILLAFISTAAFGAETKTECPWMKEMMRRSNPKAGMDFQAKVKVTSKSASSSKQ